MNAFQIAEEKTTIRNLAHCAVQYKDRDPKRAAALLEEVVQREAALNALGHTAVPEPTPAPAPAAAPAPVVEPPTVENPKPAE